MLIFATSPAVLFKAVDDREVRSDSSVEDRFPFLLVTIKQILRATQPAFSSKNRREQRDCEQTILFQSSLSSLILHPYCLSCDCGAAPGGGSSQDSVQNWIPNLMQTANGLLLSEPEQESHQQDHRRVKKKNRRIKEANLDSRPLGTRLILLQNIQRKKKKREL